MFCSNCGTKLSENENFCTNCGKQMKVVETPQQVQVKKDIEETPEDKKNAHLLCIISLILTFASDIIAGIVSVIFPPLGSLLVEVAPLCNLAGLVLMIVARVKYPKNKFAKILMWIYIILFLLGILAVVLLFVACMYTCSTMDTSGCN